MLTLAGSLGRTRGEGAPKPLPTVFEQLADVQKVFFRKNQLSMIAGAAGSGKTVLAQWLAVKAGVPCLFFSADTDESTMASRAAAILTHRHQEEIERAPAEDLARFREALTAGASHIWMDFETDHDPESIDDVVDAFGLVHGQWPELIVFDVLMSFQQGSGQWNEFQDFILYTKSICSRTAAHVLLLHHTSGAYTDKTEAPPRSALLNKVDQFPSLILTVGRDGNRLNIACVKNRNGPGDVRAERPITYGVDFSTVQLTEPSFYGGVSQWQPA